MTRLKWELALGAAAFTAFGAWAGWTIARPEPEPEEVDDHAASDAPALEAATLANLGVTVAPIEPGAFQRHITVAAVVVGTPRTEQPVYAPIGGRVLSVGVDMGEVVQAGTSVVTLLREPLPRPALTLTADVLNPAQEGLHDTVLTLRKAAEELRITETELGRVESFTDSVGGEELPLLPAQRAIDLRYELARARHAFEAALHELERHGLSEEQIRSVEEGGPLPVLEEVSWKRALQRNGLWSNAADDLHGSLPESLRALPWVTATVGELSASGLASGELARWLAGDADAAAHFLDIGVLLQRGHTLEHLQRLHAQGAFEPVVRVLAPPTAQDGGAWDVHEVIVRPGMAVASGDALVTLRNPDRLYLRSEPVGGEVRALLTAAVDRDEIAARPLVTGAGPDLDGLHVAFVRSDAQHDGTVAYLSVENSILTEARGDEGPPTRSWRLREGLRYLLRVPTDKLDDVYVLPATAVTADGPNEVVYLKDGKGFKPVPVTVMYRDHEVIVIPAGASVALFPGDAVVQTGAFELGLALQSDSGAIDPHAGHSH